MVKIKRAYEAPGKDDGYRVLVDRLWPRGRTKARLALDEWAKVLAPSAELRDFFGHDPKRWSAFRTRYRRELRAGAEASEKIRDLSRRARKGPVTLVYGARDEKHNQAVVLRELIAP